MIDRPLKRLTKKLRRGFHGYPMASIAPYGPDDRRASKLAVAIIRWKGDSEAPLRRWVSDTVDLRQDAAVAAEVLSFIEEHGAVSVAMPDRIIGCPHEEGVDYKGEYCPRCEFWIGRDRWNGVKIAAID